MNEQPITGAALRDELVRAMRTTDARAAWFGHAVADAVGINRSDMECIDILLLNGPTTAGGLAELTGLTTGAITGVIDRLESAGFVSRTRGPQDRRKVTVSVQLESVEREIMPLYRSVSNALREVHNDYTDDELALILDFTRKNGRVLREQLAILRETVSEG